MRQSLYAKVLAKMDAKIKNAFGETKVRLAPKTLIELAKQLGYIEGIRGPSGGYNATDKGLEYLGYNLEEFVAQEQKHQMKNIEENRQRQREASIARMNELQEALNQAQKEMSDLDRPAALGGGVTRRRGQASEKRE